MLNLRDETNISTLNSSDFSKIFEERCHLIPLQSYTLQWLILNIVKKIMLFQLQIINWVVS